VVVYYFPYFPFLAIEDADVDANADAGGALEKGLGAGAQGCGVVGG